MSDDRACVFFLGIVVATLGILATLWYRDAYVSECIKSGHTKSYCEMEFWAR